MNLNGELIKSAIDELLELDLEEMKNLPNYEGEVLTNVESLKHTFVILQSRLFQKVIDIANFYTKKDKYGVTGEEENNIIADFIKYANRLIEVNQNAIDGLFKGHEVSSCTIAKLYDKDVLLDLISHIEKRDRLYIQDFIINSPRYYDFYGTRLENKYIKFNSNFLDSVMTFSEASEKWGLGESTLRTMVKGNRLVEGKDFRKSGKVWLIKKDSMQKIYGEPKIN